MIGVSEALTIQVWQRGGFTLNTETAGSQINSVPRVRHSRIRAAKRSFSRHWQLYLLVLPPVAFFLIFKYYPMLDAVLAFKDYNVIKGIWGSPLIGWANFRLFFSNPIFWELIQNTVYLSGYLILAGFPVPIILALMLNEIRKRKIQEDRAAGHIRSLFYLHGRHGLHDHAVSGAQAGLAQRGAKSLGIDPSTSLASREVVPIYVWSDIWQTAGYSAVIYLAALAGVDPTLYEAAKVDGASRFQKIIHVDLPELYPR